MILKKGTLLIGLTIGLYSGQNSCQNITAQLANIPTTGGTINNSGNYYIGNDITGIITVAASDIILDLNGHNITGGINISEAQSHVTIRNGYITSNQQITNAILIPADSHNILISNLTIRQACPTGIRIEGASNISIENITIIYGPTNPTDSGIRLATCNFFTISNCTLSGDPEIIIPNGITLDKSTQGLIENCYCQNGNINFAISGSEITLSNCFAVGALTYGFYITNEENNVAIKLVECIATNNLTGFYTEFLQSEPDSPTPNYFETCLANYNSLYGFGINLRSRHIVKSCVAYGNSIGFYGYNPDAKTNLAQFVNNFSDANSSNYTATDGDPFQAVPANKKWECKCKKLEFCLTERTAGAQLWNNVERGA